MKYSEIPPVELRTSVVCIISSSPEEDVSEGGGHITFSIPGNDKLKLGARTPGCCTPEEMEEFPVGEYIRLDLCLIGEFYMTKEEGTTYIAHDDRPFIVYSGISRVCCIVHEDVYLEAGGLIFMMENDLKMSELPEVGDFIRFEGVFFDAFVYDENDDY